MLNMKNKKSNTKKIESYYPSTYLKKCISESEKELAKGKVKFYKNSNDFIKALRSN